MTAPSPVATPVSAPAGTARTPASATRREPRTGGVLVLAGESIALDRGGCHVAIWPSADLLLEETRTTCLRAEPRVRFAGGQLIHDLNLMDNLYLESALDSGIAPGWLWPELNRLFALAQCPLDGNWSTAMPDEISPRVRMQVCVGRALAADPDALVVDAASWPDEALEPARFSRAFVMQYPWRALVWATHDAARARWLRESFEEQTT